MVPDPAGIHPDSFRPIEGDGISWSFQGEPSYDAAREANGNRAVAGATTTAHEDLAKLLERFDVNQYAGSFKFYAIR